MRWLLVLCLATSVASADGYYFTEGVGGTTIKDDLGAYVPSAVNIRIAVGRRTGQWAIEGFMSGHINSDVEAIGPNLMTGGVDVKYIQPLSKNLEVYLHGSASYGGLDYNLRDYDGRGLGFGAGIRLKGKGSVWGLLWWPLFWLVKSGPKMTGALWLDDGYEYYRFHGRTPGDVINAQLTHITFGYAVGTDF